MKSGILIIDKEKDITSRDVVNKVCNILGTKKIGHTGTLDPLATGVLVLGVNEGTKIIELLTSNDKEYIAEVMVGIQTDMMDITGKTISSCDAFDLNNDNIINILNSFKGKYIQEVPKYSAVKINGKKLYEYARENIDIELPKREVEIKSIELIDGLHNVNGKLVFSFKTTVSKGTYIRSLINDIGNRLNIPMTMLNLRRTGQGIFNIENAIKLEEVNEDKIIDIIDALSNYEKLIVDENTEYKIRNGCKIEGKCRDYILINNKNNELIAIYQNDMHNDILKPYKVFNGGKNEN